MDNVDSRLVPHWQQAQAERAEERRFTAQIQPSRRRGRSLTEVTDELARLRERLDGARPDLREITDPVA